MLPIGRKDRAAGALSHGGRKCAVVTIGMFGDFATSRLFDVSAGD